MSALRQAFTDYLAMRRALGYKLDKTERLLGQFVSFVEDRGEQCLTTETALAWATLPAGADASWTSRRLAEVRIFARHLHGLDPATQVPSMGMLPGRTRRATPYLYSPREISNLMSATAIVRGSHLQATYRTLFGLLAIETKSRGWSSWVKVQERVEMGGSERASWLEPYSLTRIEWLVLELQAWEGQSGYGERGAYITFSLGPDSIRAGEILCNLYYLAGTRAEVVQQIEDGVMARFEARRKVYPWASIKVIKKVANLN
jgi:hypothetical protein